jgi:hypothetical protein
MIHRPTKSLRITNGPNAGKTYITIKNVNGSVTAKSASKKVTTITIPRHKRSKVTAGNGGLTEPPSPTMISGARMT